MFTSSTRPKRFRKMDLLYQRLQRIGEPVAPKVHYKSFALITRLLNTLSRNASIANTDVLNTQVGLTTYPLTRSTPQNYISSTSNDHPSFQAKHVHSTLPKLARPNNSLLILQPKSNVKTFRMDESIWHWRSFLTWSAADYSDALAYSVEVIMRIKDATEKNGRTWALMYVLPFPLV
jgi:hypothetical protein